MTRYSGDDELALGWAHFFAGRMAEAEVAFRSRLASHDDPQAASCTNLAAAAAAELGLGLTLAWAGSAEAAEVMQRTGDEGAEPQWAMAMALHEMSYGSGPLAYRYLDQATIAASEGRDDEYWMVHLTALGLAVASGRWGAASAASDCMVDALDQSGCHPHLVRIGRSTKWERLSASTPNVGNHPESAANWIRILANLHQVHQVNQVNHRRGGL